MKLEEVIRSKIVDQEPYVIILDEIQKLFRIIDPRFTDGKLRLAKQGDPRAIWFPEIVLGLMKISNIDVYIIGSNSKFLSSDIVTEMCDCCDKIHIQPLSLQELYPDHGTADFQRLAEEYFMFWGMPYRFCLESEEAKSYLKNLLDMTYTADLIERYRLHSKTVVRDLITVLSESVGSQVNPKIIGDTFESHHYRQADEMTIRSYLEYMQEAFLIQKAGRFDVKGRKEIGALAK